MTPTGFRQGAMHDIDVVFASPPTITSDFEPGDAVLWAGQVYLPGLTKPAWDLSVADAMQLATDNGFTQFEIIYDLVDLTV